MLTKQDTIAINDTTWTEVTPDFDITFWGAFSDGGDFFVQEFGTEGYGSSITVSQGEPYEKSTSIQKIRFKSVSGNININYTLEGFISYRTQGGSGSGDMTKAVYDTDEDGIVDSAESVDDGTNFTSGADVKDAADKAHTQDTDQYLDFGGANQISSSDAKSASDKAHDQNTDQHLDSNGPNQISASDLKTLNDTTVPAKADKVSGATSGNLASLDVNGNLQDSGSSTSDFASSSHNHDSRYLYKENTDPFTPDADYEPATKKYVDDEISNSGGGDMTKAVYDTNDNNIVDKAESIDDGGGNTATAANIADAVSKRHTAGSETQGGDISGTVGSATVEKIQNTNIDAPTMSDDSFVASYNHSESKIEWIDVSTLEGAGDMAKSVYDTDENDIVDKAEAIDDGAGNTASAVNIADAVSKRHTQNTDTKLDAGGANEVTATEVKTAVDHTSLTNNPHSVTKSQVGLGSVPNLDTTDAVNKAHDQNTDTGTSNNDFSIGDGADTDKTVSIDNGDSPAPKIRYNAATSAWEYSDDGNTFQAFGVSSGGEGSGDMTKCYNTDTDILTNRGFINITEVNKTDYVATLNPKTNEIIYQKVKNIYNYNNVEKLYEISNQQIDLSVTLNHKMFVRPRRKKDFELIKAEDLFGKRVEYKKDGIWTGQNKKFFEIEGVKIPFKLYAEFMGYYLSEGFTINAINGNGNKDYLIAITQVKKRDYDRMLYVTKKIAKLFNSSCFVNRNDFKISNKKLYNYLVKFGRSWEKYVPKEILNSSSENIKLFLESYIAGDGSRNNSNNRVTSKTAIFTTSEKMKDQLQELSLKVGWSANISINAFKGKSGGLIKGRQIVSKRNCYTVNINQKKNTPAVNHSHVKTQRCQTEKIVNYNGKVVGIEVEKYHTLYVRRNGKVCWSGNSTYDSNDNAIVDAAESIDDGGDIQITASEIYKSIYQTILLAFHRAVDDSLTLYDLIDGFVDEYEDESGVDTANSTAFNYDSTNDFYEFDANTNTVLLLHFNGSDGATTTEDSSLSNHTVTLEGSTSLETDDPKLGSAAFKSPSRTTANFASIPDNSDFDFGAGAFTIEFFCKFAQTGRTEAMLEKWSTSDQRSFSIFKHSSGNLNFNYSTDGSNGFSPFAIGTGGINVTNWHHYAITRDDNDNLRFFVDGTLEDTADLTGVTIFNGSENLAIAGDTFNGFEGQIDEVRILKGEAAYTSGFTPPSSEFSSGGEDGMTLISESQTADEQPDKGRIVLFEEDVDSITLNTHLEAYISRDGGTTWTKATLEDLGNYQSGRRVLVGDADISGQPSGTDMEYKIETSSQQNLKIHGSSLLWD